MSRRYEVVVCLKVSLTVRVDADSPDDAEDLAHDAASDSLMAMGTGRGSFLAVKEDDRCIHRVTVAKRDAA